MKRLLLLVLFLLPVVGTADSVRKSDPIPGCYPACPIGPELTTNAVAPTGHSL
ncbi:hypothetical protein [Paludibaculum fermentans]|uniref:hypothetical protein n=1 Tax=Paludibaculum fermentans TaxID=1473598 RepID=UPI003EBAA502